jgi:hypothetical protein
MSIGNNKDPHFAIPGMMPAGSPKEDMLIKRNEDGVIEIDLMGPVDLDHYRPRFGFRFLHPENLDRVPLMEDFTGRYVYEEKRDRGKFYVLRLQPEDAIILANCTQGWRSYESIETKTYRFEWSVDGSRKGPLYVRVDFNAFLDAKPDWKCPFPEFFNDGSCSEKSCPTIEQDVITPSKLGSPCTSDDLIPKVGQNSNIIYFNYENQDTFFVRDIAISQWRPIAAVNGDLALGAPVTLGFAENGPVDPLADSAVLGCSDFIPRNGISNIRFTRVAGKLSLVIFDIPINRWRPIFATNGVLQLGDPVELPADGGPTGFVGPVGDLDGSCSCDEFIPKQSPDSNIRYATLDGKDTLLIFDVAIQWWRPIAAYNGVLVLGDPVTVVP